MTDGLTHDAFLGGRLTISQPADGFRAGVDAVLLAAAIPAKTGDHVLELGCGVGTALLCLGARVPGLDITGLELQPAYADLARWNVTSNGADAEIVTSNLSDMPADLRNRSFDHVMANPPYYRPGVGHASADKGRDTALRGETDLAVWVDVAIRRLRPRGCLTIIQRMDRLPDLLRAYDTRLGAITVRAFTPRHDRNAHLVIVQATKGARAPFRMAAPIVMHVDETDGSGRKKFTPELTAILRDGAPLAPLIG
ncbi:tRNA1(Val) (adenine(37)-N6)-methyltransferase [Octadecabacter sp. R77987]|uniref:tRNA1(Val) (adenine(37)-N6)-methyltransferase n=1 Tax=Octadecabacter sp. R77987 TaxID=3093874 RepID=UPI00366D8C99